jgi:hypothetical protein
MFNNHIKKMASEELVTMDLLLKGIMVLKPITDIIENYDLLAEREGAFYKIQVKSAKEVNGRMLVDIRRSSKARNRQYKDDAYDVLAIVNLQKRQVAYIPKERMTAKASINVWCCEDYEVPTKGRWKDYEPVMFNDFLDFPF